MGQLGDCHSFLKPNLYITVIFWECLGKETISVESEFTKENAQHVDIGLIKFSWCLTVYYFLL